MDCWDDLRSMKAPNLSCSAGLCMVRCFNRLLIVTNSVMHLERFMRNLIVQSNFLDDYKTVFESSGYNFKTKYCLKFTET